MKKKCAKIIALILAGTAILASGCANIVAKEKQGTPSKRDGSTESAITLAKSKFYCAVYTARKTARKEANKNEEIARSRMLQKGREIGVIDGLHPILNPLVKTTLAATKKIEAADSRLYDSTVPILILLENKTEVVLRLRSYITGGTEWVKASKDESKYLSSAYQKQWGEAMELFSEAWNKEINAFCNSYGKKS